MKFFLEVGLVLMINLRLRILNFRQFHIPICFKIALQLFKFVGI